MADKRKFSELYNRIRVYGVTSKLAPKVADEAIRATLAEMARRANAFTEWVQITLQPGVSEYAIRHLWEFGRPTRLLGARLNGVPVSVGTGLDELPLELDSSGNFLVLHGDPSRIPLLRGTFACTDDTAETTIAVRAALTPHDVVCSLPEAFFEEHADTVALGAASRLLMMPSVPWSQLSLGQEHERKFKERLRTIRADEILRDPGTPTTVSVKRGWLGNGVLSRRRML